MRPIIGPYPLKKGAGHMTLGVGHMMLGAGVVEVQMGEGYGRRKGEEHERGVGGHVSPVWVRGSSS